VDWTDAYGRQRFLGEIVTDADHLLEVVRGTRSDLTKDSLEDKDLVASAEGCWRTFWPRTSSAMTTVRV
jgi:hypothetical protein